MLINKNNNNIKQVIYKQHNHFSFIHHVFGIYYNIKNRIIKSYKKEKALCKLLFVRWRLEDELKHVAMIRLWHPGCSV